MRRKVAFYCGCAFQALAFGCLLLLFTLFFLRSFSSIPSLDEERKKLALLHLRGLAKAIHEEDALRKMQSVFPEGACFTLTLYGLSWTSLAKRHPGDEALASRAAAEAAWACSQYEKDYVLDPFGDTEVKNGAFWMGQKNLLAARLLEILPEAARPTEIVEEFHENSRALAKAFLDSPTHHIDTYPGMCWPADNVAGLASLLIHDRLYGTNHRAAYDAWKDWTLAHLDPKTQLPAGCIDRIDGRLLQPARGCANSWMLGVIAAEDPELAARWYSLHRKHFLVRRLGFRMFREYPAGLDIQADVDSGPIILGAGMAATGIGLAAALANGDRETAGDIHSLANMFGMPGSVRREGERGRRYLFGLLPTGDAFLTWAYCQPEAAHELAPASGFVARLAARWAFIFMAALGCALFLVRGILLKRSLSKKWGNFNGAAAAAVAAD